MMGAEGVRISVKECYPIDPALINQVRKVTWLLDPAHAEAPAFLQRMRDRVVAEPGDTRLEFGFVLKDHLAPIAEASPSLSWKLTAPAFQSLRAHPAVVGAQIETKRLEFKRRSPRGEWNRREL